MDIYDVDVEGWFYLCLYLCSYKIRWKKRVFCKSSELIFILLHCFIAFCFIFPLLLVEMSLGSVTPSRMLVGSGINGKMVQRIFLNVVFHSVKRQMFIKMY